MRAHLSLFVLVLRALQAPKEPLVPLVKKAKEVPVENLVVLGPSVPPEKEYVGQESLLSLVVAPDGNRVAVALFLPSDVAFWLPGSSSLHPPPWDRAPFSLFVPPPPGHMT